eukprot:185367_1
MALVDVVGVDGGLGAHLDGATLLAGGLEGLLLAGADEVGDATDEGGDGAEGHEGLGVDAEGLGDGDGVVVGNGHEGVVGVVHEVHAHDKAVVVGLEVGVGGELVLEGVGLTAGNGAGVAGSGEVLDVVVGVGDVGDVGDNEGDGVVGVLGGVGEGDLGGDLLAGGEGGEHEVGAEGGAGEDAGDGVGVALLLIGAVVGLLGLAMILIGEVLGGDVLDVGVLSTHRDGGEQDEAEEGEQQELVELHDDLTSNKVQK